MASSAPPESSSTVQNARKPLGFMKNAVKHKHNFIQFFAMTGILLLSVRSLGQKYRIHDLQEDTAALKQEQQSLNNRMSNIKHGLLHEASLEPSGRFASRLRLLFESVVHPMAMGRLLLELQAGMCVQ
ncbi:cytoplasmic tRNA 2-thiolation protein 1-like protein [Gossypium australe]|uniref:Cytoplasmic tRNA 2-thiolation protein 1-like protein n=1 Tax=Gossypium australe TaxID=47621 RepID=A0A5B6W4X8_9ROSI|nr:cytoplasmic tRNA 2-thiolation protein 1-like protein [Gossypium australe]